MTIAAPPTGRDIAYRGFHLPADTTAGNGDGLLATGRGLALDGVNQRGAWTSPPVRVGFPVSEVVPSWTADTPAGCWIEVELRGWHDDAPSTGWYRLARWAADDLAVERTSVPGQRDGDARVDTDTLIVTGATVTGWQARVTLCRPAGKPDRPGAAQRRRGRHRSHEAPPRSTREPASSAAWGRVLDVPRYSQRLHAGQYPQWGGGGDSWCSPTCISMVLAHWGAEPTPDALRLGGAARPASGGGTRRPTLLRPRVRRGGQLVVQHRVRRPVRGGRVRHPAAVAGRGGGVHRRRHPPDRLRRVPGRRGAGARVRHGRAPDGAGRLHRRRRPGAQRPVRPGRRRGPSHRAPAAVRGGLAARQRRGGVRAAARVGAAAPAARSGELVVSRSVSRAGTSRPRWRCTPGSR